MDISLYESLDGQTALVTGATRGIGKIIAENLADLGATVYAGARDPDDIVASTQRPVQLDVTVNKDVKTAIDVVKEEEGALDILVNNAGISPGLGPLHTIDFDEFERTMAVNLRGPTLLCKHALPLLLNNRGGRVVNLSSGLAQYTTDELDGGKPAYRISKIGLGGLTAYLHAEYNEQGLMANAVSPGWVRTDMGGEAAPRSPEKGAETPTWLARFKPGGPSGKFWKDKDERPW